MNRKVLITILTILGLTIAVSGFWYVKNQQKENVVIKEKQERNQQMNNEKENGNQNQEEQKNENENGEELDFEKIDTSNWKEYCNKEYGFCVKYPEGWKVKIDKSSENKQGRISVILSNYQDSFSKKNSPNDLHLCFIDIYKKNISEYYEIKNKYRKLAKNQFTATIDILNSKKKIEVYGIYRNNKSMDGSWDLVKPVIKGFLNGDTYNYYFFHITERSNQEYSARIIFGIMQSFRALN